METRRIAVFVEGQTEQEFVKRLCTEIAGDNNLAVDERKAFGPRNRRFVCQVFLTPSRPRVRYYVLIINSSGDETVLSDLCDEHQSLVDQGYEAILGLRNVAPANRAEIPRIEGAIEKALRLRLAHRTVTVSLLLAVMEIEAWFIAECNHFQRLDQRLTSSLIRTRTGIDPSKCDVESIDRPAKTLDRIYRLVGKSYRKKKLQAMTIVGVLDYTHLYYDVRDRVPRLGELLALLDGFFEM
jgi:hypothetical protein